MKIAIGARFFTEWDVDVNACHAAKVRIMINSRL